MNRSFIRFALATLGLTAAGLAYASINPLRVTVEPLSTADAHAVLAAALTAPQGPTAASRTQLVPRTIVMDTDNIQGLRLQIRELPDRYVAILTPFAPDPQYAAHMTAPVLPAHAMVRLDGTIAQTDYPMVQVGSTWVASIPKAGLTLIPGVYICAGAWESGAAYPDPKAASYWHFWRL
jgi:hypothetical protein